MSNQRAIEVRGLGKRYALRTARRGQGLGHRVNGLIPGRTSAEKPQNAMWALRDASFDVPQGHVLGVIGRNGSGKSTLLKVLARITAPTEGVVTIHGRVAALLSIGTGFHPELSGRENIYLSASILGIPRSRVDAIFDSIVDFSGIGKFLDEPAKHYSSGMGARLGFSVSSHLDSDILLVDEVLSVGDAEFSQRASERIRAVIKDGRSVVFVSHSMPSVRDICDSAILLERGRIAFQGSVAETIECYRQLWLEDAAAPGVASP